MKPFNLEEYLKKPEIKVVTRDGKAVKIHCTNYESRQPIIAQIEGHNFSRSFTEDGRYYINDVISPYDLFFAPEKHEGWVNIYKNERDYYFWKFIYPKKTDAEAVADSTCIATVKIEWEE